MDATLEELLAEEGLVPLKELLPEKTHATRVSWIKRGLRGIRLEGTLNGGIWVSTRQALARFRARLRGQAVPTPPSPSERAYARQAARDHEAFLEALKAR